MKNLFFHLLLLPLCLAGPAIAEGRSSKADHPEFVKKAAFRIDSYVAGWYRQQQLQVPDVTDDPTFLRRAFLVGIGRIPTAEEARFFLEIDDPDKRIQLVDYLLQSKGYSSHMTNWAFDLLRVTDDKAGFGGTFEPYRHWVRTAMEDNMRWDDFTRSLLTASGNGWDHETAAVGYYIRDRGMPLDNLANTTRIFLGSRMECAQCHDDPFGDIERRDFYELAGFTTGQGEGRKHLMRDLWDEVREDDRRRTDEYRVAQILWDRVYGMTLSGGGNGRIQLPSDYQYRDGDPGEWVGARTPFGRTVRMSDRKASDDGREELAEWVVGKTDTQFPSVIANRMWKRVMGRGVYEPVDEFVTKDKTHLPGLMGYLTDLMVELDYDLKGFQKVLLNTKTFQFVPNPEPSKVHGGDDFHGRQLTRLSAEQIWDSLITLASGNPDEKPRRGMDDRVYVGNKPVLVGKKTMKDIADEVLALDSEDAVRDYADKLLAAVQSERSGGAKSSGDDGGSMMSMTPVQRYGNDAQVRASELPSPAPRNHLLYLFGQSDREVVEASSREPNVGQVLSLMNGFVQQQLVNNPGAHLYKSLEGASTPEEKIRRLYIAILNRPPNADEMSWMTDELKLSGEREGYQNMVSALVMSSEFLFLQ